MAERTVFLVKDYAPNQVKILKRLKRKPIDVHDIPDSEDELYRFLQNERLIDVKCVNPDSNVWHVVLSECGKAYLAGRKNYHRRYFVSLVFSALALAISILSLLL